MRDSSPLQEIVPGIWIQDQALTFAGLEMGARMTVIALSNGEGLLLHSPVRLSREIQQKLDSLGEVRHIIAPNLLHHLFAGEAKTLYPQARLYGAPGLEKKRSDLRFDSIITSGEHYPWSRDLDHHVMQGIPRCNEVVFCHRSQKTLVVTDLGIHICEDRPPLTRFVFDAMGMLGKFGWSRLEKWLFIRNQVKFQKSIAQILSWDFDRILLSHGRMVESGGHAAFEKAYLRDAPEKKES